MSELALFGGPKTITEVFPRYNPIGEEEVEAKDEHKEEAEDKS